MNTAHSPNPCYEAHGLDWEQEPLARPSRKNFADNLTELMTEQGLTDVKLGELIKRSGAAVGRWRQGLQEPSFEIKDQIAQALGVPVSRLYQDPTDEESTGIPLSTALSMVVEAVKKAQESEPSKKGSS